MIKFISLSRAGAQATAVLGACLLAFAGPASAYSPSSKTGGENTPLNLTSTTASGTHTSSGGGGASIERTIVGLAIVLAVIWGLYWILRQVKAGRDPHVASVGLTSVAALTLSGGRSVHLIRAGSDYVLLGSAEHGLVPIHRYTEAQAREAGLPLFEDITVPSRRRSLIGGLGVTSNPSASEPMRGPHPPVRPDPMRMPSHPAGVVERLREWSVRS
jgi:flagellar protein FliO/FliZ